MAHSSSDGAPRARSHAAQEYKIFPKANDKLTAQVLQLAQQAASVYQLRIGANETTKALNSGKAELVIIAADCDPIEYVLHLPMLCEDKNVPYIFIPSRQALGRAADISRATISAAVCPDGKSNLRAQLEAVRGEIEKLME
eukprot:gnl/Chilomastix_cuspidata/445.p3 GENE.gnl/Chilomastix_cuspidata/445~~gnl/Chilomastix_cuspidata/445.p3  ORF type:complete len:141 (-),score=76.87 gnl/Chilomastix_cuspidata/445:415-837(-)